MSSLSLVRVCVNVIVHRSRMIAKLPRDRFATPRIVFQIATKSNIPIVQESIDPVIAV